MELFLLLSYVALDENKKKKQKALYVSMHIYVIISICMPNCIS